MNINRQNYEEHFLLYVDNELTVTQKKAVETFIQENPDLEEELVMLQQSVLHPNQHVVFDNKESLLKNVPADGLVNTTNYQEYFVLYGDNELTSNQKDLVDQFVGKHPQYQQEFELIQQARLLPDNAVVFPDKNDLYRSEEEERVVPFQWRKLAVAAVILLFMGGFGWYVITNNQKDPQTATGTKSTNGLAAVDNKTNTSHTATPVVKTPAVTEQSIKEEKKTASDIAKANTANKKEAVKKVVDKPVNPNELTAAIDKSEKNAIPRNNNALENVSQKENVITAREVTSTLAAVTRPARVNVEVTDRNEKEARSDLNIPDTKVVYINDQPAADDYADNNTGNKQRPLRGFFRKVTRVFDKATNADNESNKKGIRIASFEIALK